MILYNYLRRVIVMNIRVINKMATSIMLSNVFVCALIAMNSPSSSCVYQEWDFQSFLAFNKERLDFLSESAASFQGIIKENKDTITKSRSVDEILSALKAAIKYTNERWNAIRANSSIDPVLADENVNMMLGTLYDFYIQVKEKLNKIEANNAIKAIEKDEELKNTILWLFGGL